MKLEKMKQGILRQNVYLQVGRQADVAQTPDERKQKYVALVQTTVPDGIKQEYVEYDYPITRETVKSYVDSTNYKVDPLGSVGASNPVYSDIRDLQKVADMDMETARALRHSLDEKIRRYNEMVEQKKKDVIVEQEETKKVINEVKK